MAARAEHRRNAERNRAKILRRDKIDDGWICVWCEKFITNPTLVHVDHLVSVKVATEQGWELAEIEAPENLAISCATCNTSRGARPGPPTRANTARRDRDSNTVEWHTDTSHDPARGQWNLNAPTIGGTK